MASSHHLNNSDKPILIVAHDAGGAEILSSWVVRKPGAYQYALRGPAIKVFARKLGNIGNCEETLEALRNAIASSSSVLCGTGWQSDWEFQALRYARELGTPSASFIDHWVNYHPRFERGGVLVLPDRLLIGDEYAEQIAHSEFPNTPIQLEPNPYFLDLQEQAAGLPAVTRNDSDGKQILYVCEPIADHAQASFGNARHWGYTEFDALEYFLSHAKDLGEPVARILVRPHPSEAPDKYREQIETYPGWVIPAGDRSLLEEVHIVDSVIGCNSMAMVIGLLLGKQVFCCIPPGGPPCALPHKEIKMLREMF